MRSMCARTQIGRADADAAEPWARVGRLACAFADRSSGHIGVRLVRCVAGHLSYFLCGTHTDSCYRSIAYRICWRHCLNTTL